MSKRPKNYAPMDIVGEYKVEIFGNKVEIYSYSMDKKVAVKCHPDDEFDIGEAIRISMGRILEDDAINVGDIVKIVDNGESYCTETDWPNHLSKFACKFRYGVTPDNGIECKVVAEFPSSFNNRYLVQPILSERYCGDKKYRSLTCRGLYLMGEDGLKKVNKNEA